MCCQLCDHRPAGIKECGTCGLNVRAKKSMRATLLSPRHPRRSRAGYPNHACATVFLRTPILILTPILLSLLGLPHSMLHVTITPPQSQKSTSLTVDNADYTTATTIYEFAFILLHSCHCSPCQGRLKGFWARSVPVQGTKCTRLGGLVCPNPL